MGYDPIFANKASRPDTFEEEDPTQTAVIFHPEATKLIVSRRHWNILEPDLFRIVGYSEEAVAALMSLA